MKRLFKIGFLFIFFCLLSLPSASAEYALYNDLAVTAHPKASEAAIQAYLKGGNAIDAAVAAGFALGVVEPHNSGIGGGGFMMIYWAKTDEVVILDYRESAPKEVTPDLYRSHSSTEGYAAAGTPGQVRGLTQAQKNYGRLSLKETIAPSLLLAEKGFSVSRLLAKNLEEKAACLGKFEDSRRIFYKGEKVFREGELLVQKGLAGTLRAIADKGEAGFYEGRVAQKIDRAMGQKGGVLKAHDLQEYRVKERKPLWLDYHGYRLALIPLPSSGGILISQILQMIQNDPLKKWGWGSFQEAHLLAEAMELAFFDRARYLGDGDFVSVPVAQLTSPEYAREQRGRISFQKSLELKEEDSAPAAEGKQTTHAVFSDRFGNVVSMTNSLNLAFGSCATVPGTGILLNNEMDDFAAHLDAPNAFGLLQGRPNRVEPGKRPLSSMSPTLVFKEGKPVFALGSPGGPKILTNVLQVLINVVDHGLSLEQAVARPKIHHQYQPDRILYEEGYPELTRRRLKQWGRHEIQGSAPWGNVQILEINWTTRESRGFSDPRGEGVAKILQTE